MISRLNSVGKDQKKLGLFAARTPGGVAPYLRFPRGAGLDVASRETKGRQNPLRPWEVSVHEPFN
jgi:hypothetical protein